MPRVLGTNGGRDLHALWLVVGGQWLVTGSKERWKDAGTGLSAGTPREQVMGRG